MVRAFSLLLALAVALVIGVAVWRSLHSSTAPAPTPIAVEAQTDTSLTERPAIAVGPSSTPGFRPATDPTCSGSIAFAAAAQRNADSAANLAWSPFGRPEIGWRTYWRLIANEIGTGCAPASPAFADALARWQAGHRQTPDGVLTAPAFDTMKAAWQAKRPYVALRGQGVCPEPPAESSLATASAAESYGGKTILLRSAALAAYRRMVEAARKEVPGLDNDPQMLRIFSAYRSPDYDAARCAKEGNCQGVTRAQCSAHRTGLAIDIAVGHAPGYDVDSSADANRLAMTQTPAYAWLLANAGRFGFVNYPFEPWHWEWTGEAF